ncbi:hypothetical protein CCR96_11930 [Halochromatium roseum]|nr:hypothetical protein [Halochromatium roseum]
MPICTSINGRNGIGTSVVVVAALGSTRIKIARLGLVTELGIAALLFAEWLPTPLSILLSVPRCLIDTGDGLDAD